MSDLCCSQCGIPIPDERLKRTKGHAVYCSNECLRVAYHPPRYSVPVSTGTTGAISELIVAADLLQRGFHVFRAMSPSCPCDLIAIVDGIPKRVEVRTGNIASTGLIGTALKERDMDRFDILAIVLDESTVVYLPDPATDRYDLHRIAPFMVDLFEKYRSIA